MTNAFLRGYQAAMSGRILRFRNQQHNRCANAGMTLARLVRRAWTWC